MWSKDWPTEEGRVAGSRRVAGLWGEIEEERERQILRAKSQGGENFEFESVSLCRCEKETRVYRLCLWEFEGNNLKAPDAWRSNCRPKMIRSPKWSTAQTFNAKQFGFEHLSECLNLSEPEFNLKFGQPEPENVYPDPTRFLMDKKPMIKPGFFGSDKFGYSGRTTFCQR